MHTRGIKITIYQANVMDYGQYYYFPKSVHMNKFAQAVVLKGVLSLIFGISMALALDHSVRICIICKFPKNSQRYSLL